MTYEQIQAWLREESPEKLQQLWQQADSVRAGQVGDAVHLRGLVELSNICARNCHYCGIRAENTGVTRYRMTFEEAIDCARRGKLLGYGTLVIQAGEDPAITTDWMSRLISEIKRETDLAVTLSLGERDDAALQIWREAGADRYLLRFETSNDELYHAIHPPPPGADPIDRIALLRRLRSFGYEVGSGVLIGIPGQTYANLARSVQLFGELDLDMIGVGPYIAHPDTPLSHIASDVGSEQVPNSELMAYKVVALARLTCPAANIPSTTALATLNKAQGREYGLQRGANVVMPNLTPVEYRSLYEIYPGKACINETAEQCSVCLAGRIASIGRTIGKGRGDSPNWQHRHDEI